MTFHEAVLTSRIYYYAHTISTLTFGVYLTLTIMGIVFLLRRKHQRNVNLVYSFVMLGVTIAWFVTNTINNEAGIIINLVSPLQTSEDGLYCATANVLDVALASAIYVGSDILLIYRVYVLFGNSWAAATVPFIAWLAFVGVAITIDLPCALSDMPVARVAVYERIAQAYYVLPFIPNLLCTALIIGKFAAHTRVLRNANLRNANNSYWLLTSCIAESGIVYSAAGIVHCVLWWRQAELYVVTQAIYLASAYLCEAHIILRLALGVATRAAPETTTGPSQPIIFAKSTPGDSSISVVMY